MKFSIIIPVAPDRNAPVLESLERLDYPKKDYKIIVEKGLNPSENRNRGIRKAKGEILFFLDDDAVVDENILKNAEKFFVENKVDVVGGPQLTPKNDKLFAKTSGFAMSSFLATHKMSNRYKKGKLNLDADEYCLASANLFVKKQVFNSTAGFDSKLYPGEDSELIKRLKSLGFKIAYSPNLYIYHKRRPTFRSFFKQFFNYGKVYLQKEKTKSMKPSLLYFFPSLFLLYLISLIFLYRISLLFLIPLGVYVILVLLNSFYLSIKNKNVLSLLFLPLIFLSIHVAYGFGVMVGLSNRVF